MGSVRRPQWRQYIPFLILNVVISALTMSVVLALSGRPPAPALPTPTATLPADLVAASAVPTATATTRPSPTPHTYLVKPGDTMFEIAASLGVPVEALMAANGLTDPDALTAGQVLLVPEGDITEPATAEPATAAPTAGSGESPRVEIRGVSSAGVLEQEAVRLLNSGGTANMQGWTLEDGRGRSYAFPAFTLHNGAVSVHSRAGTDTVIDLYWGLPEPIWSSGVEITLRDADGNVQSTFRIP